jgi:hypothetical protein
MRGTSVVLLTINGTLHLEETLHDTIIRSVKNPQAAVDTIY